MQKRRRKISVETPRSKKKIGAKNGIDQESVLLCKNIYEKICDGMKRLETKCGIKFSSLTDMQFMDLKKDIKSIDVEFTGIIDKMLKLTESNPSRYTETEDFIEKVSDRKVELNKTIDTYKNDLESEI